MVAPALTAPLCRVALFQDLSAFQISEIARYAERVMFMKSVESVRGLCNACKTIAPSLVESDTQSQTPSDLAASRASASKCVSR